MSRLLGFYPPKLQRDEYGHRTYKITALVQIGVAEGPLVALNTPGLPIPGSPWQIKGEFDLWAWFRSDASVNPVLDKEWHDLYTVEMTCSTKPPGHDGGVLGGKGSSAKGNRCQDVQIGNPLLEPPQLSGGTVKFNQEAMVDRFGRGIMNSAFERLRGPQVEFEGNRPTVKISLNIPVLNLAFIDAFMNTVNSLPMWGFPRRCVKLSDRSWEQKSYGQCYTYYTLHLTFDIDPRTFDRDLLDEGTKVLKGHWNATTGNYVLDRITGYTGRPNPNPRDPRHFIRAKDRNGENFTCILNGAGNFAGVTVVAAEATTVMTATSVSAWTDSSTVRVRMARPTDPPYADGGAAVNLPAGVNPQALGVLPSFGLTTGATFSGPFTVPPLPSKLQVSITVPTGDTAPLGIPLGTVTSADNLAGGTLIIEGKNAAGTAISESFPLDDSGESSIVTTKVFASVTSVRLTDLSTVSFYNPPVLVNASAATIDGAVVPGTIWRYPTQAELQAADDYLNSLQVSITTPQISNTFAAGSVHVEYYPESNLALLGIPLAFA